MKSSSRRFLFGVALGFVLGPVAASRADLLLHDFETGTEGWENEAASPVKPYQATNMVHRGKASLAFDYKYGKGAYELHVRCKEGYPRDFSSYPAFRGFAAWVYIYLGEASTKIANFEVQMFVRSGETWQWTTGEPMTELGLGWIKVDIRRDQIFNLAQIQDIGIQVRNRQNDVKATIYIDQVEAVGVPAAKE